MTEVLPPVPRPHPDKVALTVAPDGTLLLTFGDWETVKLPPGTISNLAAERLAQALAPVGWESSQALAKAYAGLMEQWERTEQAAKDRGAAVRRVQAAIRAGATTVQEVALALTKEGADYPGPSVFDELDAARAKARDLDASRTAYNTVLRQLRDLDAVREEIRHIVESAIGRYADEDITASVRRLVELWRASCEVETAAAELAAFVDANPTLGLDAWAQVSKVAAAGRRVPGASIERYRLRGDVVDRAVAYVSAPLAEHADRRHELAVAVTAWMVHVARVVP